MEDVKIWMKLWENCEEIKKKIGKIRRKKIRKIR
jgi:hypothetical protein